MLFSFHELVRRKGDKLTESDIVAFAEQRRRECNRSGVVGLVAFIIIAGLMGIYLFVFEAKLVSVILLVAVMIVSVISVGVLCASLAMSIIETSELNAAESALKHLGEQAVIVERALATAAREQGMALFLRSFEVEYSGSSDEEIERSHQTLAEQQLMYTQMTGGIFVTLPQEEYKTKNLWTAQMAAMKAIQARWQTVLLENINLSDSKRAELEAIHVLVVPVVIGEWWPVFTRLAMRASVIVVHLQNLSVELRREIEYFLNASLRYIVICREETKDNLQKSDDALGIRLLDNAAQVVTYHDANTSVDELRSKLSAISL